MGHKSGWQSCRATPLSQHAIVQISWTLTTEYSDTQVVAVVNLDPAKTDEEKAAEVNAKLADADLPKYVCAISRHEISI